MQLVLTVLRCPDAVSPESRTVSGGEFTVGRGPGVDWVLPDPERLLSKRHFALAYRGAAWQVADISTNGTFLNREDAPIGKGEVRALRDGDRVRLGAYEIEVRLIAQAARGHAAPAAIQSGFPHDDPFAPAARPVVERSDAGLSGNSSARRACRPTSTRSRPIPPATNIADPRRTTTPPRYRTRSQAAGVASRKATSCRRTGQIRSLTGSGERPRRSRSPHLRLRRRLPLR